MLVMSLKFRCGLVLEMSQATVQLFDRFKDVQRSRRDTSHSCTTSRTATTTVGELSNFSSCFFSRPQTFFIFFLSDINGLP
jgi:hypothetical protein